MRKDKKVSLIRSRIYVRTLNRRSCRVFKLLPRWIGVMRWRKEAALCGVEELTQASSFLLRASTSGTQVMQVPRDPGKSIFSSWKSYNESYRNYKENLLLQLPFQEYLDSEITGEPDEYSE